MLAGVTPAFFWKIFFYICPVEYKNNIVVLSILAILGFDIAWATVLIKGLFVKNIYLRIFLIWLVFTLTISIAICLLIPYMLRGAFAADVGHILWVLNSINTAEK